METIKQTGRKTMLYTYYNFYNNHLQKSRLLNYTLWMAYYTDNNSLLGDIVYDGWQYASDGNVHGVDGRCDMNLIFKSMISGNKQDNPLLKKEEKPPETSNADTSSTDSEDSSSTDSDNASSSSSETTSENSSVTSSSSSSEVTSSENSETSSENNGVTSSENTVTTPQNN